MTVLFGTFERRINLGRINLPHADDAIKGGYELTVRHFGEYSFLRVQPADTFKEGYTPSGVQKTPDGYGRLLIPKNLRAQASLDDVVNVIGCNTYLEVWSKGAWDAYCSRGKQQ